jgi:hypothetical protein
MSAIPYLAPGPRRRPRLLIRTLLLALVLAILVPPVPAADARARNGGVTWPRKQALPTFSRARHLDVADIEQLSGAEQIMLVTLQGVVNRREPRLYLLQSPDEEGKYTWLRDGLGVPYTVHRNAWSLVARYRDEVKGSIIYDPEVPDSINVATTLAGLRDAVVASPELAKRLAGRPYNLPVLEDLRGRFEGRLDAYTWQYEHLWPRTTHRMLVGLAPQRSVPIPPGIPEHFRTVLEEDEQIRDASNRDVYELDLSEFLGGEAVYLRFDDAFPEDGWGPAVHEVTVRADGAVIAQFVAGTDAEAPYLYDPDNSQVSDGSGGHRFADNGRYFVYRFAPPAGAQSLAVSVEMWNQYKVSATSQQPPTSIHQEPYGTLRDYAVANRAMVFWLDPNVPEERALLERILGDVEPYTPYLGWFAQDVAGEFEGTELVSSYGVYVLAADWFSNMTVFSGTRAAVRKPKRPDAPPLENKIYVTFTMSEGDNLQYNQHRMRVLWDDSHRGSVPINWTTNPLLLDAAPAILGYYARTATANDLLIAGPSGAGYIYPTPWPDATFGAFTRQSAKYMRRTGMDVVYVLNRVDGQNVPLSESEAQAYIDDIDPPGILLSWESETETTILPGGTPQSTVRGTGSASEMREAIAQASAGWDGRSPLFISIGVLAWSTTPEDVHSVASSLGPEYEVVAADHYFELVREAHGLRRK